MKRPTVSVVIATLNRHQTLRRTLPALFKQEDWFDEVIIVDQTDEIPSWFKKFLARFPKVRFERFSIKRLTSARNYGAKLAQGEIIVFVDDDSLVLPGFFKAHLKSYKDPEVGGVTGREILQEDPSFSTSGKGQTITEKGEIIPNTTSKDRGEVDSLWGANMSLRRRLLEKIGGFDEDILLIRDESDVSLRLKLLGYKIIYEPKAKIIHLQEKKGGTRFDKRMDWYFKFFHDEIYFQLKYFSFRYLWHFFWRKLRPILACMFYYGKGHPRALLTPFKAFWAGYKTYLKNKCSPYVPLRIGIDAHHLGGKRTGKETYALGILKGLAKLPHTNLYFVYAHQKFTSLPFRFQWRLSRVPSLLWYLWALLQMKLDGVDFLFAPTSYVLPSLLPKKSVVVIHDLAVFRKECRASFRARLVEKMLLRRVLLSRKILAISRATKEDLKKNFAVGEEKIAVLYPGLTAPQKPKNSKEVLKKLRLKKPYILAVGTIEPRKNFARLIKAYRQLPSSFRQKYDLVLVGKEGWFAEEVMELVKKTKGVKWLGYLSDSELGAVFAEAEIFAFPSLWEGFGLPILEAFHFEVPTLTSKVASLPEVGGKAVLYCQPKEVVSIKGALLKLLQNPSLREKLVKRGRKRLKRFRWARSAKKLIRIFSSLCLESKRELGT